jgi:hypothetical protein
MGKRRNRGLVDTIAPGDIGLALPRTEPAGMPQLLKVKNPESLAALRVSEDRF